MHDLSFVVVIVARWRVLALVGWIVTKRSHSVLHILLHYLVTLIVRPLLLLGIVGRISSLTIVQWVLVVLLRWILLLAILLLLVLLSRLTALSYRPTRHTCVFSYVIRLLDLHRLADHREIVV